MFVKSFIYLTIIVIIAILNNVDSAKAKSYSKDNKLANLDGSPESPSAFESYLTRSRRDIQPRIAADKSDISKNQLYAGSRLRFRRETPPAESGEPKQLHKDFQLNREKRQIPSPPENMPMPPM